MSIYRNEFSKIVKHAPAADGVTRRIMSPEVFIIRITRETWRLNRWLGSDGKNEQVRGGKITGNRNVVSRSTKRRASIDVVRGSVRPRTERNV